VYSKALSGGGATAAPFSLIFKCTSINELANIPSKMYNISVKKEILE